MKRIISIILLAVPFVANAQLSNDDVHKYDHRNQSQYRTEISIPGFDGYATLKCDFHIHTVFSDGSVWPSIRVQEAWKEGLDAIAITDHIEYRPHKDIVVSDHNESYNIAKKEGDKLGFMVIKGAEITRSKPLGHLNALFISDANALDVEDPLQAIDIAEAQGAYIIWNHPGWPDDKCTMYPLHEKLIAEGKIHGFEVWNDIESYPLSYDWVSEYGLHPFANSDIHGTISDRYAGTRPLTLVFAKERTHDSVKEAMFAGRVLALFNNFLMGKEEFIAPLVKECLSFQLREDKGDYCIYNVVNNSDIRFQLQIGNTLHQVTLNPHSQTYVEVAKNHDVTFVNCILGIGKYYSAHQSEL